MTYLTSHSTLDQEHIKLFASLVNKITDKDDQQAIIDGANMVFRLYGEMLTDLAAPAITLVKQSAGYAMKLKDKRVLLTGATGGIGRALCLTLVEAGCHLILVGRDQAKLDQLIDELPQSSNYLSIAADISCPEGIATIDKECQLYIQEGIDIDIVINNAGCNTFAYLAQRTPTSIEQEIAVNISATIQLTKLSLTWLNHPGIILNVGSTFAAIGYPGYATYCATKGGYLSF